MVLTDVWAFANAFHEDIGLDLSLLFPLWLESGLGPCHAGWSERIMVLFVKDMWTELSSSHSKRIISSWNLVLL